MHKNELFYVAVEERVLVTVAVEAQDDLTAEALAEAFVVSNVLPSEMSLLDRTAIAYTHAEQPAMAASALSINRDMDPVDAVARDFKATIKSYPGWQGLSPEVIINAAQAAVDELKRGLSVSPVANRKMHNMHNAKANICQAGFDERRLVADFDHVGNEEGRQMVVRGVRVEIPESFFAKAEAMSEALRDAGADCATYRAGFAAMSLVAGANGDLELTSDFGDAEDSAGVHDGNCEVVVSQDGGVDISMWSFDDNMEISCYLGTVEELHAKFEAYNKGLSTPKMRG